MRKPRPPRSSAPSVGAAADFGDDDRLPAGEVALELFAVGVAVLLAPVVVDADNVERRPVDGLDGDRRVGERPVEGAPGRGGRLGEEAVERLVVGAEDLQPHHGLRHAQRAADPVKDRVAGQDAAHEQRQLRPDAQDHPARPPAAQRLGRPSGARQVVEHLVRLVVPQLRGQPRLQAGRQGYFGGRDHPVHVLAADPHGRAVQVFADDLQFPCHDPLVEVGPLVLAAMTRPTS